MKFSQHDINHTLSAEELDSYFQSKSIQDELNLLFRANIIRWQFGRLLELYILLDRAILLEENGLAPKIEQFFDHELSPRNIAIYT